MSKLDESKESGSSLGIRAELDHVILRYRHQRYGVEWTRVSGLPGQDIMQAIQCWWGRALKIGRLAVRRSQNWELQQCGSDAA